MTIEQYRWVFGIVSKDDAKVVSSVHVVAPTAEEAEKSVTALCPDGWDLAKGDDGAPKYRRLN